MRKGIIDTLKPKLWWTAGHLAKVDGLRVTLAGSNSKAVQGVCSMAYLGSVYVRCEVCSQNTKGYMELWLARLWSRL